MKKSIDYHIAILWLVAICSFVSSCDTIDEALGEAWTNKETKQYVFKCAWCRRHISEYTYVSKRFGTVGGPHMSVDRIDPFGAIKTIFGDYFDTTEEANRAAQNAIARDVQAVVPSGGYKADGATFCSLKCVNAYAASKGIKEERLRIIYGE